VHDAFFAGLVEFALNFVESLQSFLFVGSSQRLAERFNGGLLLRTAALFATFTRFLADLMMGIYNPFPVCAGKY